MELDINDVFASFLTESDECLAAMESGLLELEQQPDSADAVDQVFRAAHTIKGNSASLGFKELVSFSHEIEDLLHRVRTHQMRAESDLITILLSAVDAMKKWVPRLRLDGENLIDAEARAAYERVCAYAHPASQRQAGTSAGNDETKDRSSVASPELSTIRVQTSRMDSLLNLTGEVAIAVERVRQQTLTMPDLQRRQIGESIEDLERLLRDVHGTVMRCRMVAIGPTFRRHRRTVRDLAAAKGKQVTLDLSGEDVEVDVSVIEALADPLMHMIRNAIDHGIEMPQARLAIGKRATGTLTLHAFHERGSIVVQVIDDGGGIRRDRVRERALAMGLPAEKLTDDELMALVFQPGFSTAENVTETSGRGVGMDVVRRNVERIRGRITLESVEGKGTTLTMRLPLTLAVIPGFIVSAGGELFVIPMSDVDECLARPEGVERTASGIMYVRGEAVPYVRLRDCLGFGGASAATEVVVVVDHYNGRAAFVVDEVVGEAQTVIKPLSAMLQNMPGITGTAVMGNGSVAMVLEPAAIFREMERSTAA